MPIGGDMRLQPGFLNVTIMGLLLGLLLACSSPVRAQTATDCTVPNVVNTKEYDARSVISSAGMVEAVVGTQCAEGLGIPSGYVISQNPPAGTQVQCGSHVDLVISYQCVCTVPNVVGKTLAEAKSLVNVRYTAGEYSATVPAGIIFRQDPPAGTRTYCFPLMDLEYSIGPVPPIVGSIVINSGRSATNNPAVTLRLWAYGGSNLSRTRPGLVDWMRFSDDGTHWSSRESTNPIYNNPNRAYTLPAGPDGVRTVYVQFLNSETECSPVYSDSILLDTVPPTGSILINNGVSATKSQAVTLHLTWADTGTGVVRMRFSDDGAHWTAWERPKNPRAYTLPAGLGYHTVRVQFLDRADNYSAVYNDYINLIAP
jgi:hypothetical protein